MDRRTFVQRAAALGLITVADPGKMMAAPIPERMVRGHVVAGEQPLSNVRVSDGFRVSLTDDSGQFFLPVGPDSGPFLFITTPGDYWTDVFYVPIASALEQAPVFRLRPVANRLQHRLIYLTDLHLGEGHAERSYQQFLATLDELNQLDPLPAVCWVGGDITLEGGEGRAYVEAMKRLKVPVRNAVGNHELLVRERDPRQQYQQLFGPTWYSFDVGKVHYVTLDGCRTNLQAEGYKQVEGWLSPRELHWLREDLRHVPAEMPTVVAIHIPLESNYATRRGTTAESVPYWIVKNATEVIDLLSEHGVSLVLQGHLHENYRTMRQGIEFVESISVCGKWWKAAEGAREEGVSGEPRGYRILDVDGSTIRHRYQSSCESRTDAIGEIVGRPEHLPRDKPAELLVNIFDAAHQAQVSGSLDDGPFEPLAPTTDACYHETLQAAHHWRWTIPNGMLSAGRHRLRVRVQAPNGASESFEHEITS